MARNRVFLFALGLSTLIHLSMVTVFSIVIFFPAQEVKYYSFDIIEVEARKQSVSKLRKELRVPSVEDALKGDRRGAAVLPLDALPAIELPTLEFEELARLRVAKRGLELGVKYGKMLDKRRDTWARFSDEMHNLGSALSRFRLRELRTPTRREVSLVARPAPGFEAYITWMAGPRDRQLLSAPPITALWGIEPDELTQEISMVFKVNPEGKVISVLTPLEDEEGIIANAGIALLKYRFAPWDDPDAEIQQGALLIRPERND